MALMDCGFRPTPRVGHLHVLSFLQLIKAGKLSSAFGVQQRIVMTFAIWDSSDRPMIWSWAGFPKVGRLAV